MTEGVTKAAGLQCDLLSFRATMQLIEQTRRIAGDTPLSEYLCQAVREKNEREQMPELGYVCRQLAARSAMIADAFDVTAGDGL